MTKLVITRGLPGSGKSTWAREWVSRDTMTRAEVNRDKLRDMAHGGFAHAEVMISTMEQTLIRELLINGVDVVCSDTNLPNKTVRELIELAQEAGAEYEIHDMTNVPLQTCLSRNEERDDCDYVPVDRIMSMYAKFIAGRPYPLPLILPDSAKFHARTVTPDYDLPPAYIVDIDGTLAFMGDRDPYDETKVSQDKPRREIIETTYALWRAGYEIIIMSGRMDSCRADTEAWLDKYLDLPYKGPFMRAAGDIRKDAVVKRELFERHVLDKYRVIAVLDDRDQVVDMWRRELGLNCLQVNYGRF